MAQKEQNGYRYLLDASTEHQYAIPVVNGALAGPVQVVNGRTPAPNSRTYALDDDIEYNSDTRTATTTLYQLTAREGGRFSVEYQEVTFKLENVPSQPGQQRLNVVMTEESKAAVRARGIQPGFPERYTVSPVSEYDPETNRQRQKLVFPPQHKSARAEIARDVILKRRQDEARAQFNGNGTPGNNPQQPQPPKTPRINDAKLQEALDKFTRDLTSLALTGRLDPVIGRDQEIEDSLKILMRRKQGSLCLTGDPGVGKTVMFGGIAQALVNMGDKLPKSLQNARVLELDMSALVAGTQYRGALEERLNTITEGLREREGVFKGQKVILAIDEIHSGLNMGGSEGGSAVGQQIKPFLTARGISVIGATTDDEYRKHIESDGAMARRFRKLRLGNPDEEKTVQILQGLWPNLRKHHSLTADISEDDLRYIVTTTSRYSQEMAQPSISEDVMSTAAASAEYAGRTAISRDDINMAISKTVNLPLEFVAKSDVERVLNLKGNLQKRIFGQDRAIEVVDEQVVGSRSGLNDPNQPRGAFLFLGPTGTGKTELSKALAESLFGDENALISINMARYSDKHTVSGLIGATAGFVGYDDETGLEPVRKKPYSVVLFDEVEKAHPDVFDILLSILQEGGINDSKGRFISFKNTFVVLTSNLGAREVQQLLKAGGKRTAGPQMGETSKDELNALVQTTYEKAAQAYFKPEVLGRIDQLGGLVTFLPLEKTALHNIANAEIRKANARLNARDGSDLPNVRIELTEKALDQAVEAGFDPSKGARALRGTVSKKINNIVGRWVLAHHAEAEAFVAKNGPAKIVIDDLENVSVKLVKDDKAKKPAARKVAEAQPSVNDNDEPALPTQNVAQKRPSNSPAPF